MRRRATRKNFVVYDTVDQKALLKSILKDQNIDTKEYPINYLSSIISKEKEADSGPRSIWTGKEKTLRLRSYTEYTVSTRTD